MSNQTGSLIYLVLLVVLVASSLFVRRLPFGQTIRMMLAWALIFITLFVVFTYRAEFALTWERVKAEAGSEPSVSADGSVRLQKSPDGHFHVSADVNGQPISFLIDSGATTTAISGETARRVGVQAPQMAFPVIVQTANGSVAMQRARLTRLVIGPIVREDFPVLVSDQLGSTNLLGMNFLSSLRGWRIEGDVMVLNP